jgi:glycosyltransferase involved in cell wall biosynthesis
MNNDAIRVLFLTQGETIPSSRFRVGQFLSHFDEHHIECTVCAAYDERYNEMIGRSWLRSTLFKLTARAGRALQVLRAPAYDVVFVQRPTFPFSALPERILRKLARAVVFDIDDAIFLDQDGNTLSTRWNVVQECARQSDRVIAGNRFLKQSIEGETIVEVIPTVIDTERYSPAPIDENPEDVVVGWMGTAGNFPYLETVTPELKAFLKAHPEARLRLVSNATFEPLSGHPQVEQHRWSAEREIEWLRSFDIGLMPLHDTAQTRGKCAFKMIQYMSVGIPYVASPVGANVDVHGNGEGGALANFGEWQAALESFAGDEVRRRHAGAAGRTRVVEHYSIDAVLPDYLRIFRRLANR